VSIPNSTDELFDSENPNHKNHYTGMLDGLEMVFADKEPTGGGFVLMAQTIDTDWAVSRTGSANVQTAPPDSSASSSTPGSEPLVTVSHRSLVARVWHAEPRRRMRYLRNRWWKHREDRSESGTDNAEVGGSIPPSPTEQKTSCDQGLSVRRMGAGDAYRPTISQHRCWRICWLIAETHVIRTRGISTSKRSVAT
jgi:hypothetical protein